MSVDLVATVGSATANSYTDLDTAETYFEGRAFATAWTGESDDDVKEQALVMATAILEREKWAGTKGATPATAIVQALAWPRRWAPTLEYDADPQFVGTTDFIDLSTAYYSSLTIPAPIVAATCELALVILQGGTTDPFTRDTKRIKRKKVDVLETEYFASQDQIRGLGYFPHVTRLIAHLLRAGGGTTVERV